MNTENSTGLALLVLVLKFGDIAGNTCLSRQVPMLITSMLSRPALDWFDGCLSKIPWSAIWIYYFLRQTVIPTVKTRMAILSIYGYKKQFPIENSILPAGW